MNDPYTAAQEAEILAQEACTRLYVQIIGTDHAGRCFAEEVKGEWTRATTDAQRRLCLSAAAACEALSAAVTRCDHDCQGQTRADITQALADDFAARAVAWRRVGGGTA